MSSIIEAIFYSDEEKYNNEQHLTKVGAVVKYKSYVCLVESIFHNKGIACYILTGNTDQVNTVKHYITNADFENGDASVITLEPKNREKLNYSYSYLKSIGKA